MAATVRDSKLQGKGLFATRAIQKKGKILEESPVAYATRAQFPSPLWEVTRQALHQNLQLEGVPEAPFDTLSWDSNDEKQLNALTGVGTPRKAVFSLYARAATANLAVLGGKAYGLYPLLTYVNHSCLPNATVLDVDVASGQKVMMAIKDISEGEEITITYCRITSPYDTSAKGLKRLRQFARKEIKRMFGFDCRCSECVTQTT